MLSHVQLLARALGIPNVVLGPAAFDRLRMHDGKTVLLIVDAGRARHHQGGRQR